MSSTDDEGDHNSSESDQMPSDTDDEGDYIPADQMSSVGIPVGQILRAAAQMSRAGIPAAAAQPAYLNIRVVSQDGNTVYFRMRGNTQLRKLMEAYCARQHYAESSIAFLFYGRGQQAHWLRREHTPDELGMKDGDEIYAILRAALAASSDEESDT